MKGIIYLLIFLGCIVTAFGLVLKICDKMQKEKDEITSRVGKRIILEKDTLMSIDFSILNSNYKLSNGKDVSFELIEKLQIIK